MPKRLTREEFIARAKHQHGDLYDYSLVDYRGLKKEVKILCPTHGFFWQEPGGHSKGLGCQRCGRAAQNIGRKLTAAEFIRRSKLIHGDRYCYDLVDYRDLNSVVEIICQSHGSFKKTPASHLYHKSGCQKCGNAKKNNSTRSNTEEFITKAKLVHQGCQYNYDSVVYLDARTKVVITCLTKKHGPFQQTPNWHLSGAGCPKCAQQGWVSKRGSAWLNSLKIESLQREWRVPSTRYIADGYDPITNTIYEFHGTHWHGHPDHRTGKLAKKRYAKTLRKEARLRELGYNLVVQWEHDEVFC